MNAPNSSKKPSARYMDFIGPRRPANGDPLVHRPATRPSRLAQPTSSAKASSASSVRVSSSAEKPYISRKPATSRDLYMPANSSERIKTTSAPHDATAAKASAALSGATVAKSPFLPSYQIEKRPLSSSVPPKKKEANFEKLSFLGVSEASEEKPHKNDYTKRESKKSKKSSKDSSRPVKIIDDAKPKSGFPLILIILLTIILGAAVGAGVYFLLPK
ncbi:hypothetical protein IJH29_02240 [Candidatus Saccharibacteria bacterium]|nr:hypothetical protein [Candidatus Saccharibacteria bacterium]